MKVLVSKLMRLQTKLKNTQNKMISTRNSNIFTTENGEEIPLVIVVRMGSRNITIRPKTNPKREIHISIPARTPGAMAMKFLEQKRKWIEKIYSRAPQKVKLCDGDKIMICGNEILITANKNNQSENCLLIGGSQEFFERRCRDKIKEIFLSHVKEIIRTTPSEFHPKKIAIRDTTTRWGSCSSTGTISFSWRLAFAPYEVMRYVIMHELAHKKHMDHSPAFWAVVLKLYGNGVGRAKLWLSNNGTELHKYF